MVQFQSKLQGMLYMLWGTMSKGYQEIDPLFLGLICFGAGAEHLQYGLIGAKHDDSARNHSHHVRNQSAVEAS
jgi:hypothetical protein